MKKRYRKKSKGGGWWGLAFLHPKNPNSNSTSSYSKTGNLVFAWYCFSNVFDVADILS